jgi:hypothetical protein
MNWLHFVGEGRCGHTILSAIIDSHPNASISEEEKPVSRWLRDPAVWDRQAIIARTINTGLGKERKVIVATTGLTGLRDSNKTNLLVMGDKCGWDAVNEVRKRNAPADILTNFGTMMDMPVKVLHVSRHPLDNISAWVQSPKYIRIHSDIYPRLRAMIRRYSRFYTGAEEVMAGQDVFHLRHEELVKEPYTEIEAICKWLGLPVDEEWLTGVSKTIYTKPNNRFEKEPWQFPELVEMVYWRIIDKYPSLAYYKRTI